MKTVTLGQRGTITSDSTAFGPQWRDTVALTVWYQDLFTYMMKDTRCSDVAIGTGLLPIQRGIISLDQSEKPADRRILCERYLHMYQRISDYKYSIRTKNTTSDRGLTINPNTFHTHHQAQTIIVHMEIKVSCRHNLPFPQLPYAQHPSLSSLKSC